MLLVFGALSAGLSGLFCALSAVRGWLLCPLFLALFVGCLLAVIFLYVLCLLIVSFFLRSKKPMEKDHPVVRFFLVETLRSVCTVSRVKIRVEGAEKLPEGRFLFVSNHRSLFDGVVSLAAFRKTPLAFVAKPGILRAPLIGNFARYCGFLPIDREDARSAIRTINAAAELMKRDICSVGIYPEGTRNRAHTPGETLPTLLPFHDGVLMIAQKAKVPIVVVSTHGTAAISRNFPFRRSSVTLSVREVLPAAEVASARTSAISERICRVLETALIENHA
ncbi:MAG: 1-acyl-sn-glycerol-3-phosphate acyltransferase [Oscillospiraceae bacterium]|nr:1-acyl-sn-glycerol-3-phosphate acyltransferase [Oscillospiraceae bacterium]